MRFVFIDNNVATSRQLIDRPFYMRIMLYLMVNFQAANIV